MGDDATGMPIDRETNAATQQSLRVLTLTLPESFSAIQELILRHLAYGLPEGCNCPHMLSQRRRWTSTGRRVSGLRCRNCHLLDANPGASARRYWLWPPFGTACLRSSRLVSA